MRKSRLGICLWAVVSMFCGALAHASSSTATPEDEYKKLIRVSQDIQPLGEHPFGENIGLYNGALSFEQTDISLPGNGPLLQLTRRFGLGGVEESNNRMEYAFGDWDLEIPHLETLTAGTPDAPMWNRNPITQSPQKFDGWQVDNYDLQTNTTWDSQARCSHFGEPAELFMNLSGSGPQAWEPGDWWKGYQMVIPGQGSEDLLGNPDAATRAAYPVVTKSHWRFSCLANTSNGEPGEAFLAQAPDGTKYWFNRLVYRYARGMSRQLDSAQAIMQRKPRFDWVDLAVSMLSGSSSAHAATTTDGILRRTAWMMVTKIEDRFGNTLTFNYDGTTGLLTGIVASDGRSVTIQYVSGTPRIHSITLNTEHSQQPSRTWTYDYSADGLSLISVTQPDASQWHFALTAFDTASITASGHRSCISLGIPGDLSTISGTITHPSGLTGTFTVKPIEHGRSFTPTGCQGTTYNDDDTQGSSAVTPDAWYSFTIVQRTLSGAGLPTRTWNYAYSSPNASWVDCTGSCPTTVWTDVQAPDQNQSTTRYTFSNRFGITESQLQRVDYYDGAAVSSNLLRSELNYYATPNTQGLPAFAGANYLPAVNTDQTDKYSPLNKRVTTQDGDTYTWQAEAFNSYAQVTQQKRYNSISGEPLLEESLGYLNDTNLWVLGLPTTVTNVATGEVESQNVYDTTNDTLKERWRFGEKLMSYTFDSAGNLASFTDGNTNTTNLDGYYRGIPTTITYPAVEEFPTRLTEKLEVDDFGEVTSLTNQAGKKTLYSYYPSGRIKEIDYPTGDAVAWAPKKFSYDPVPTEERGIGANHWRRTVTQGDARWVTYFDAELQPILSDTYISTDGSSHVTVRTDYDWRGQKTFVSYPRAGALNLSDLTTGTTTQYDALGRVWKVMQDSELGTLTSTTAYLSGARVQVTDPRTKVTTTTYQVFDQPSYDNAILVQAPDGINQAITRDVYGNPQSIRQYGSYDNLTKDLTKYLYYDSYHRLCRTAEPESGSTVIHYDAANNVDWTADGLSVSGSDCGQSSVADAAKTKRKYDALNRVTTLTTPADTQDTSYTYDALGNVQTAVSGISTWAAGPRNGLGLPTSETLQITGQNAWTLGYAYDANGSLSSITYPDDSVVAYAPDALGRPTQAGSYATGVSYFPNGEVSAFTFGNGALYAAQQNARQLLSNFSYAKGSTLNVSEDYVYDNNANITRVNDLTGGPRTKSFGYDDLNRLTSATATNLWGTESYKYDPLNNIASRTANGSTVTYNYNGLNQLIGLSDGTTFGYDDNRGNVTSKNGVALTFDAKNQLQNVGGNVAYSYDASGRRVSKTPTSGGATYYFYSQAGQLMYQREPDSNKGTDYIYLGKRMLARNEVDTRILTPSEVDVTLTLVSGPTLSADAQSLSTVIDIANHGDMTLTSSGPYPVHLGDHIVSPTGSILVTDLDRVNIPDIAPGQHAAVTITTPTSSILGTSNLLQFIPVQEGVAWFTSFGTTPVNTGPFTTPSVPAGSITGAYTVSWAGVSGATSYNVQEQKDGGSWTLLQPSSSTSSKTISGRGNGTYGYQVQACNGSNCSNWSTTATTTVLLPPGEPTSITVPATSSGSIAVSWAASSTATRYVLQQRLGTGDWINEYNAGGTSTTVTETASGSYIFQVVACNASGCSGWRGSSATVVTIPPSGAPSVSVPSGTNPSGSFSVSWTGVSTATSYMLQERVNGGSWMTVQSSSATSKAISGKGNGTYGYQARGCNAGGCGPWSSTASATVLHVPVTPGGLHATDTQYYDSSLRPPTYYDLSASWNAVTGAATYDFNYCQSGGSCLTQSVTSPSTFVEGRQSTTSVTVRACNASGCSAWSGAVTPVAQ